MSESKPSDFQVRLDAVDPSRSFLVQAPAGSGKTELLTDRILALLALVQKPEEIVAITFTRAAAAEMHARVIEKLQAALGPEPEEAYKKNSWVLAQQAMQNNEKQGWNLLEHPARLSIRTIDSLCSHLVRAMPWLSGLGGVPEVSDQASLLYLQAAQSVIAMADEQPSVSYLVKHLGVNIADVEQLLVDMLAIRDQWLPTLGQAQALERLQDYLNQLVTEHLERVDEALPLGWQDLAPAAVYAHRNLAEKGKMALAALESWSEEDPLFPVPEDLARWQALIPFLTTSGAPRKPRGITATVGFPANGDAVLRKQLQDWLDQQQPDAPWVEALLTLEHLQPEYTDQQVELLGHLSNVLWLTVAQLRLEFIDAGQVDFIEIAQRALNALGAADNPSDLLLRLDRRISHLLVDEFQDTSLNQIELLERLTSGWQADDGRTVFLVGDPMQSIYRFRKAEVGLFLHVQQNGRLGEVELEAVTLTNNFRSTANVVQWVNQLGGHLFPLAVDTELGAVRYNPSEAFHGEADHSIVQMHPLIYSNESDDFMDADQARSTAEQRVVQLCAAALQQYPDSTKPVAVLVRARTHLGELIRALTVAGIPTKAVDIDSLTARPVVQDIVQLVRALKHAGDRLAWLSLLRSPICGLRLTSLHTLCGHDRQTTIPALMMAASQQQDLWQDNEWQRLQHVAAVLLDDRHRSGSLPFAAWVEHCWHRLGGEHAYPLNSDRADAENVFRLLERVAPYGEVDLDQFEEQVTRLYATAQNAERAVEVMTFHKSKGLEFESVILYDLNRSSRAETEPLLALEQSQGRLYVGMAKASDADAKDGMSQFIAQREKQRAAFELQRLLYVGVTRARSQLHLVGLLGLNKQGDIKAASGSLMQLLWPVVETQVLTTEPLLRQGQTRSQSRSAYQYLQRIKNMEDLPPVTPREAPAGVNHWEWSDEPFKEAAIGTVAHAWLERIGRDGREQWSTARISQRSDVIERQLLRAGIVQSEVKGAVAEVVETLTRTIDSERGQWLLDVAQAYREWTLLDAEGRVSIIDLAISQDDQWLIVDYKTSMPHAGQSQEAFLAIMRDRYGSQLRRYCDQVTAFDGRKARAALYFPRADLWYEI